MDRSSRNKDISKRGEKLKGRRGNLAIDECELGRTALAVGGVDDPAAPPHRGLRRQPDLLQHLRSDWAADRRMTETCPVSSPRFLLVLVAG